MILPEMLGYGETDRPTDPTAYSRVLIADAVAGILAAENVDNVIVLGHDWVRSELVVRPIQRILVAYQR